MEGFDPKALIYLALIIGYFLYELFVRSKKTQEGHPPDEKSESATVPETRETDEQQAGKEEHEQPPFESIESWFEEVGKEEEPEEEPIEQPTMDRPRKGLFEKKKEERAKKLASDKSAYEPIEERKVKTIAKKKHLHHKIAKAETAEETTGYFDREPFDLKKAIIFSEVLHPKHF